MTLDPTNDPEAWPDVKVAETPPPARERVRMHRRIYRGPVLGDWTECDGGCGAEPDVDTYEHAYFVREG